MPEATNSLAHASSAYLRSAMHQPMQWHEWGEEAFAAAQRENKPILLDIGAVWCHWCHVMDRESYENAARSPRLSIAQFIAVKVDRDERPDVDSRYQRRWRRSPAQGGWPLTVFLTPDGKPFYGGTYFPPEDRYGRPSFKQNSAGHCRRLSRAPRRSGEDPQTKPCTCCRNAEGFAGRSGEFSPRMVEQMVQSGAAHV